MRKKVWVGKERKYKEVRGRVQETQHMATSTSKASRKKSEGDKIINKKVQENFPELISMFLGGKCD